MKVTRGAGNGYSGADGNGDSGAAARRASASESVGRRSAPAASRTAPPLGRRALITGGAGFIGTNVAARLAASGWQVHLLDNLSRPGVEANVRWLSRKFGPRVTLDRSDVRDAGAVQRAVDRSSLVFHLAAQVAVTTSLADPQHDFDVNARGTLNVLEACRRQSSPPPLLFTSTNKVYGTLGELPLGRQGEQYCPLDPEIRCYGVGEHQPLDFHSPYGCSKGVADQYVLDYARCWNLPAVVFRMSCIYGPHQCGNEDQGWVAHFVRQVLNEAPITFYGDGYQVRDLLYVEDLVDAMLGALDHIDTVRGCAFNVGGGAANAVSLRQVIDLIGRFGQRPAEVRSADWRQGDQRYYVSDTRRLAALTGWCPEVPVRRGVGRLYRWMGRSGDVAAAAM